MGNGNVEVATMNIMEVMKVVNNDDAVGIANEVQEKLALVLENIG